MSSEYPNDGQLVNLPPPQEQIEEAQLERARVVQSYPIIDDVIAWVTEREERCDSIKGAHEIAIKYDVPVDTALIALDIMRAEYSNAKSQLNSLKGEHLPGK